MTAIAIKRKILTELESTSDKNLLQSIYKLLNLSKDSDELMKLTAAQKKSIKKGLKDIEKGNTISNEKANKEIDKWLSE